MIQLACQVRNTRATSPGAALYENREQVRRHAIGTGSEDPSSLALSFKWRRARRFVFCGSVERADHAKADKLGRWCATKCLLGNCGSSALQLSSEAKRFALLESVAASSQEPPRAT